MADQDDLYLLLTMTIGHLGMEVCCTLEVEILLWERYLIISSMTSALSIALNSHYQTKWTAISKLLQKSYIAWAKAYSAE
jgi:hypothetical protein